MWELLLFWNVGTIAPAITDASHQPCWATALPRGPRFPEDDQCGTSVAFLVGHSENCKLTPSPVPSRGQTCIQPTSSLGDVDNCWKRYFIYCSWLSMFVVTRTLCFFRSTDWDSFRALLLCSQNHDTFCYRRCPRVIGVRLCVST